MSRFALYSALLAALVVGVLLAAGATAAPPDPPKIDSHPTNPSEADSASFTFSDDKKVDFRCQLDSGRFSDCGSDVKSGSIDYPAALRRPAHVQRQSGQSETVTAASPRTSGRSTHSPRSSRSVRNPRTQPMIRTRSSSSPLTI